ncbi:MAG: DNA translocase FtsK, partial [Campylobacteraceae bacterium]|nr:DNA translocase FtsK [Campylobacteraceae bacterium]
NFVPDQEIVGTVGVLVSKYSFEYLGYIAYIFLAILLYPLYLYNFSYIEEFIEKSTTSIFLFFTTLIAQSLILTGSMSGKIGNIIVNSLSPFIGSAGLWLFVIIGFVVSFLVLFKDVEEIVSNSITKLLSKLNKKTKPKFKSKSTSKIKSIPKSTNTSNNVAVLKDDGDVAEIIIEQQTEDTIEVTVPVEDIEDTTIIDIPVVEEHTVIVSELEENKKLLDDIEVGKCENPDNFKLPKTSFFQKAPKLVKNKINEAAIDRKVADLLEKLAMFKIDGDVVRTYSGPIVTTFEFKPAPNVKVSKILNLQDDLAMALKAQTIRIQAPIPGKDVVGIEVPNDDVDTIYLRDLLESELFENSASPLTMILGKDIVGNAFVTDLKKLPHLLIAGTTGSGKSVGINAMILSLLYKNSPDNLKLIMIDPKMLEFSMYNDIPHLLTPVITKPNAAINALANMVGEMERRYKLMANTKTKNIENYNEKAKKNDYDPFPYIVIIIDELADLMMTSGKDVELSIARLAQMARASGIHLIVATQRPSVDVVTGLIKANLPSRVSYKVGQKIDSKIILDAMGAESLLGRGDLLFTPPGSSNLVRIHAPWSDEVEIEKVVDFLKSQRDPQYDDSILKEKTGMVSTSNNQEVGDLDPMFEDAKSVVLTDQKTSISYLQRKLRIGYNRSATIIEQLETMGILSSPNTKGNREIL